MSGWNYRLVRTIEDIIAGREYVSYAIHEAHYDTSQDAPHSITARPMTARFDSVDELRDGLTKMLASLDKPVLNYEDY